MVRAAVPLVLAAITAGCAGQVSHDSSSSPVPAPPASAPAVQQLGRSAQVSAWSVIGFLRGRGLPVPHPLDVTDQACRDGQCRQSVITDTIQVTSFASASAARDHAHQNGSRAESNIVVTFAPVLNPTERQQLWSAVKEAVQ